MRSSRNHRPPFDLDRDGMIKRNVMFGLESRAADQGGEDAKKNDFKKKFMSKMSTTRGVQPVIFARKDRVSKLISKAFGPKPNLLRSIPIFQN